MASDYHAREARENTVIELITQGGRVDKLFSTKITIDMRIGMACGMN